jgi:transposase-like protein
VRVESVDTRDMNREQSDEVKAVVVGQRRRMVQYSAAKRRQLLEAAKRRWSEGASIRAVADELGVSVHTLSYWRAVEGIGKNPKVKRVEIVKAEPARSVMAFGPHGLRMQLAVDAMAELLRKLG